MIIRYRKGYKYQLAEDTSCHTRIRPACKGTQREVSCQTDWLHLGEAGLLVIRKGYAWNGPSGPTIDTKSSMRGSLQHDAKHQLIRLGLVDRDYLSLVDEEFRTTLLTDGMWRFRVLLWIWALHTPFASKARPSGEKLILTAP